MRVLTLVGLLSTLALPAWAARPFVTDDARLTTAGSCQLESWVRTYPQSRETWALPACNPGGNLELPVGGGWARYDDAPATKDQVFQLKTLFRPLETNGWGWGLAVGTVRHRDVRPNLLGHLPMSRYQRPFSTTPSCCQPRLAARQGDTARQRDLGHRRQIRAERVSVAGPSATYAASPTGRPARGS
jgi:hypothetical protein